MPIDYVGFGEPVEIVIGIAKGYKLLYAYAPRRIKRIGNGIEPVAGEIAQNVIYR